MSPHAMDGIVLDDALDELQDTEEEDREILVLEEQRAWGRLGMQESAEKKVCRYCATSDDATPGLCLKGEGHHMWYGLHEERNQSFLHWGMVRTKRTTVGK